MPQQTIHPDTRLGHVHLTVSNLNRSLSFYRSVLGFQVHRQDGTTARLGAGGSDILRLTENPAARPSHGTTGLYHFAVLVPSRLALARSLRRLASSGWPLQGVADHWVSEALYLADPDGNGIEIYRDRPRDEWPYQDGQLLMATDPLDLQGLLDELDGSTQTSEGLPPDTILGHMHLQVSDVTEAESFYVGVLGFEPVLRFGPSARFVSAGGYHHHIGLNTWGTAGAPPPPPDAVGLREFVVRLPHPDELSRIAERAKAAGVALEETEAGPRLRDPSHNAVVLTAAREPRYS